jgi:peptide/nickel transport system ATP-binding protein
MSYPSSGPPIGDRLIRARGLTVRYAGSEQTAALREADLDIARGEIVGVLGESGSGKSTLALSLLGLLPANASVQGSIFLHKMEFVSDGMEEDLLRIDEARWQTIRGVRISMIFQEPGLSLSPVMRVGDQVAEVLRAHGREKQKSTKQEVEAILCRVRLPETGRVYAAYPHQLSGGELHRVAIAQALACGPELMIADEPTRSLDVTVQAEVLNVLREVNRESGSALLFITHNPALLAGFADRVIVMYAGRMVEEGPVRDVFQRPLHPYTRALLELVSPHAEHGRGSERRLPAIPGSLAESDYATRGCIFEPRCSAKTAGCRDESPASVMPEAGRRVSFNYGN